MRLLKMLLSFTLVLSFFVAEASGNSDVTVKFNGEVQSYDQPPVIENGRTLVPLRGIFESLGANVSWDGKTKTITAFSGDVTISLSIDALVANVNEETIELENAATIINGRTMVPLRFISESMGANISWDSQTRTIAITKEVVAMTESSPRERSNQEEVDENSDIETVANPFSSYTSEELNERLIRAIANDEYQVAKDLLEVGANPDMSLALLMAAIYHDSKMTEILLEGGADPNIKGSISSNSDKQNSALYNAIMKTQTMKDSPDGKPYEIPFDIEVVNLLIKFGAKPDVDALTRAAFNELVDVVELFLTVEGIELEQKDSVNNTTPMEAAQLVGNQIIIDMLINYKQQSDKPES